MKLFENFDKINKTNTVEYHKQNKRIFEHENQINLFDETLVEGDNEKRDIVLKALSDNVLETTPEEFYGSLSKSKHPNMLTPYTIGELSNMKLFKVPNLNIGYALKDFENKGFSELVAVHNNEPDITNIGRELIKSAVRNGACYLDHFSGYLDSLYEPLGFVEYKRDSYNPIYDKDGSFADKYGKQDVVYRKHKNRN